MRIRIPLLLVLLGCLAATTAAAQQPPRAPRPVQVPQTPQAPRAPLRFGFMLESGPPPVVLEVMPASPAERAGVREGDILVTIEGQSATVGRVQSVARRIAPGDTVRIRIRRDGRERDVRVVPEVRRYARVPRGREHGKIVLVDPDSIQAMVKLYLDGAREALKLHGDLDLDLDLDLDIDEGGDRPFVYRFHADSLGKAIREQMQALGPQLRELGELRFDLPQIDIDLQGLAVVSGARLTDLNDELARYFPGAEGGALVLSVRAGSPAARAGLQAGDVIVGLDGESIEELGDLHRDLRDRDRAHELSVVRRGERLTLRLEPR